MGLRGPKLEKAGGMKNDDPLCEEPPEWMYCSDDALQLYRILAVALNDIGLVRSIHTNALATYCESWEREREMQKAISDDGEVLENLEKGTKYLHPALNAQKMAQNEMARQAKILGMEVAQIEALAVIQPPSTTPENDPEDANSYLP